MILISREKLCHFVLLFDYIQPATLPEVQLTFEENLVGDLLFDVRGQIGALPLLQFTLDQLFQQRDGHQLTLSAYHEMGGIKGALSRHVEQTYQALPSSDHHTNARALFLRLIDPGITEQDTTRRRASLSEFTFADAKQTHSMQETIEAFVKARLLTTNQHAGRTTIEVSHEAVIREWKRLADWLHEAREDIRLQQIISEDAATWEQHNKLEDRLYRGSQLKEAQAWVSRNTPSSHEAAFLQASEIRHVHNTLKATGMVLLLALLVVSTTGLINRLLTLPNPNLVNTLQDTNNPGSLRYAINDASPDSTIRFDPSLRGTIGLTKGDLNIAKNLTILGPGVDLLSISNDKSGHIIHVVKGTTVTISGLTFKDSKTTTTSKGFIYNEGGTLTLSNSTVSGNTVTGYGGGIYNDIDGSLTLSNSTVSANTARIGGGIFNDGMLTLSNSTVSANTATRVGDSYSIYEDRSGGGIFNQGGGVITLSNSTISGNTATDGDGGGGIYNNGGVLILSNSTISGNTATGHYSKGGGINNWSGTITLNSSTVAGNTATNSGGGIFNFGGILTLSNSTVSDNTAPFFGGIFIESTLQATRASLIFSTVYDNTAFSGGDITIKDFNYSNGKPIKQITQVKIGNSIVAGDPAHPGPDIVGMLTSYGYNLFQNNSGTTFDPVTRTQHSTDKMLSASDLGKLFAAPAELRNNGGSTKTLALTPGSPAVDQIPLATCRITVPSIKNRSGTPVAQQYTITTDQRGRKRPGAGKDKCDIGAYEYKGGST